MNDNHDAPIARHPRVFKTYELLNRHYWWLSQLKDVKMYVKGCSACQQNKALRQKKAAPLNPHTPPESPWESISLDVIGLLPESNGFNAILSVIDQFSKNDLPYPDDYRVIDKRIDQYIPKTDPEIARNP